MRAVLTRVKSASVTIDGNVVGKIGKGFATEIHHAIARKKRGAKGCDRTGVWL